MGGYLGIHIYTRPIVHLGFRDFPSNLAMLVYGGMSPRLTGRLFRFDSHDDLQQVYLSSNLEGLVTQMLHVYMHVWCIFCIYYILYGLCLYIYRYVYAYDCIFSIILSMFAIFFLFYPHERVNYRCKSIRSRILLDLIWIGVNKICQFSLSFALEKIQETDWLRMASQPTSTPNVTPPPQK